MHVCMHGWMSVCVRLFSVYSVRAASTAKRCEYFWSARVDLVNLVSPTTSRGIEPKQRNILLKNKNISILGWRPSLLGARTLRTGLLALLLGAIGRYERNKGHRTPNGAIGLRTEAIARSHSLVPIHSRVKGTLTEQTSEAHMFDVPLFLHLLQNPWRWHG